MAKAWKNSSPESRLRYENTIIVLLRELQEAQFKELLDKAGAIAEENGLIEEKLNQLLNEED